MTKVLAIGSMIGNFPNVKCLLEEEGFQVVTAYSSSDGLRQFESDPSIDLVVVDADSTEESGWGLLSTVKCSPRLCRTPILIMGESFSADHLRSYRNLGVDDAISLPCDGATLLAKLERAAQRGKPTVLVVDDEPGVVEVLTHFLELERCKTLSASTAEDAIVLLECARIHAVVTDIGLPGMSGLDLLTTVKRRWPETPVIIITGQASRMRPAEATASGADAYFAKPFKKIELIQTLRRVLRRTNPHAQQRAR